MPVEKIKVEVAPVGFRYVVRCSHCGSALSYETQERATWAMERHRCW